MVLFEYTSRGRALLGVWATPCLLHALIMYSDKWDGLYFAVSIAPKIAEVERGITAECLVSEAEKVLRLISLQSWRQ